MISLSRILLKDYKFQGRICISRDINLTSVFLTNLDRTKMDNVQSFDQVHGQRNMSTESINLSYPVCLAPQDFVFRESIIIHRLLGNSTDREE